MRKLLLLLVLAPIAALAQNECTASGFQSIQSFNAWDSVSVLHQNACWDPIGKHISFPLEVTAAGITGSGTAGFMPVFTGPSAVGNSPIQASSSNVAIGQAASLTGAQAMIEVNQYNGSGATCTDSPAFPVTTPPCAGFKILDQSAPTTNLGFEAGLVVLAQNTLHNTSKLMGLYSYASTNTPTGTTGTDEWGAYIVAEEAVTTTVTNRHGAFIGAFNDTPNTSALVEGLSVETGGNGGTTTTTDYTIHVQTPFAGDTLTTHAGIEVEAQGTGVPIQMKPVGFATLPACSATYEGSTAAVNDANQNTWGTAITAGSSTNHVLAYCDGTSWTVAGK